MYADITRAFYCISCSKVWTLLTTNLLTPCSRVLHEKLTGSQPVKKFPSFYGTPEPDQSNPYPPFHFLKIHLNIILPSTPRSSKWPHSLRFPLYTLLLSPIRATCPAQLVLYFWRTLLYKCVSNACVASVQNGWQTTELLQHNNNNAVTVRYYSCRLDKRVAGPHRSRRNAQRIITKQAEHKWKGCI